MALGWRSVALSLLVAGIHGALWTAPESGRGGLETRQLNSNGIPSDERYLNRVLHSTIILKDRLFIDGGEISFLDEDGEGDHLPVSDTYSIDLSSSWTNKTVTFSRIKKSAPVLNGGILWPDSKEESFYAWGGEQSEALSSSERPPLPPNSIWSFSVAGKGDGSWTEKSMSTNSGFDSLSRPAGATGAYGKGTGYFLGGYKSDLTSAETSELIFETPTPGMVSYNSETGKWANQSASGYSFFGTAFNGEMQLVPDFGKEGILIAMGGQTSNARRYDDSDDSELTFGNINMFNPATGVWLNQTASGAIPAIRSDFCSVGVPGDDGTYEIFIYGGQPRSRILLAANEEQRKQQDLMDEVYVLSLPGFVWTRANYPSENPRTRHRCNARGRQMIVTGGLNPSRDNRTAATYGKDIWTQGIGVFDLADMAWKNGYDVNAAPYETPKLVKSWYNTNGRYPVRWDDPATEKLITNADVFRKPASRKSNTAAIAGGVVGGVVVLALIVAAVWLFRRRRARRRPMTPHHPWQPEQAELKIRSVELDESMKRGELGADQVGAKRADVPPERMELLGNSSRPTELGGSTEWHQRSGNLSTQTQKTSSPPRTPRSELP